MIYAIKASGVSIISLKTSAQTIISHQDLINDVKPIDIEIYEEILNIQIPYHVATRRYKSLTDKAPPLIKQQEFIEMMPLLENIPEYDFDQKGNNQIRLEKLKSLIRIGQLLFPTEKKHKAYNRRYHNGSLLSNLEIIDD